MHPRIRKKHRQRKAEETQKEEGQETEKKKNAEALKKQKDKGPVAGEAMATAEGGTERGGGDDGDGDLGGGGGGGGEAVAGGAPVINVGDIVTTYSARKKDQYDNQQCEIVSILSKQYKVMMLTGSSKDECHKFDFGKVTPTVKDTAPQATGELDGHAPEPTETPGTASDAGPPRDTDEPIGDLFTVG